MLSVVAAMFLPLSLMLEQALRLSDRQRLVQISRVWRLLGG